MPQLKLKTVFKHGSKEIKIIGEAWGGGDTDSLQIQLESRGDDFFIDLSIDEVTALRDSLTEWIDLF